MVGVVLLEQEWLSVIACHIVGVKGAVFTCSVCHIIRTEGVAFSPMGFFLVKSSLENPLCFHKVPFCYESSCCDFDEKVRI